MSKPEKRALRLKELIDSNAAGLALAKMVVKIEEKGPSTADAWKNLYAAARALIAKAGQ